MKKIAITLSFIFSYLFIYSQDKEEIRISAGATYNNLFGTNTVGPANCVGYFFATSTSGKMTNKSGYTGTLSYIDQHAKINDSFILDVKSVNAAFNYNFYPFDKGLKLTGGFQIGVVVSSKIVVDKGLFMGNVGLGYEFEKLEVFSKYNFIASNSPFSSMTQLGVGYKIF